MLTTKTWQAFRFRLTLVLASLVLVGLAMVWFGSDSVRGETDYVVEVYPDWQAARPFDTLEFLIITENNSTKAAEYELEMVTLLPEGWDFQFDTDWFYLEPGEREITWVEITLGERDNLSEGLVQDIEVAVTPVNGSNYESVWFTVEVPPPSPDLAISELDLEPMGEGGEEAYQVSVGVFNAGEVAAGGWVRYYESDPNLYDIFIFEEYLFVPPGETNLTSLDWIVAGNGQLLVEIEPDEVGPGEWEIEDWDWSNNWALESVNDSATLDLSVSVEEIYLIRDHDELALGARVYNQGDLAGYAQVAFYMENEAGEFYDLAEEWVMVPPGEPTFVMAYPGIFPSFLAEVEAYNLTVELVTVGPLPDLNPDNDWATTTFPPPTLELPDLSLFTDDLILTPAQPVAGESLSLQFQVFNLGGKESFATVELYPGEPFMGEPLAAAEVYLGPGENVTVSLEGWRLEAGNYSLTLVIEERGPFPDVNFDNNAAVIEVEVQPSPEPGNPGEEDDLSLPGFNWPAGAEGLAQIALVSLAAGGALGGAAALWQSERSRWWIFAGFFFPLLSRIKREELEEPDKFKAGRLYQTIVLNPGINLTALIQLTEMGNGTLIHHLSRLERDGLIRSLKQGQLRVFYSTKKPVEDEKSTKLRYLRNTQKRVLRLLAQHPESSQREIAEMLAMKQQLVSYHLRELLRMGYIRRRGLRKFYSYSLEEEVVGKLGLESGGY